MLCIDLNCSEFLWKKGHSQWGSRWAHFGAAAAPRQRGAEWRFAPLAAEAEVDAKCTFGFKRCDLEVGLCCSLDGLGEPCAAGAAPIGDLLIGVSPEYPALYGNLRPHLPQGTGEGCLSGLVASRRGESDAGRGIYDRRSTRTPSMGIARAKGRRTGLTSTAATGQL